MKKISRDYARRSIAEEAHYSRYSRTFRQAHIQQLTSRLKVRQTLFNRIRYITKKYYINSNNGVTMMMQCTDKRFLMTVSILCKNVISSPSFACTSTYFFKPCITVTASFFIDWTFPVYTCFPMSKDMPPFYLFVVCLQVEENPQNYLSPITSLTPSPAVSRRSSIHDVGQDRSPGDRD